MLEIEDNVVNIPEENDFKPGVLDPDKLPTCSEGGAKPHRLPRA